MLESAPPLILVAEDDDIAADALTTLLRGNGFEVAVVGDGQAAIDALKDSKSPAVIVLDLTMPLVSGWDVLFWLLRSAHADVPVIVWSAAPLTVATLAQARVVPKGDWQLLLTTLKAIVADAAAAPAP